MALAVAPIDAVEGAKETTSAQYPMLADPQRRVAEAYGIYNLLGDGYAAPAVFVIDQDGRIIWSYVGEHPGDRPPAPEILSHLP